MFRYVPFEESLFSPSIGVYHSFGIAILQFVKHGWKQIDSISDVSTDYNFVEMCIRDRCRGQRAAGTGCVGGGTERSHVGR